MPCALFHQPKFPGKSQNNRKHWQDTEFSKSIKLMHIPVDGKGLIQHDIQEFRKILNKYGFDWFTTLDKARENMNLLIEKEKLEKRANK